MKEKAKGKLASATENVVGGSGSRRQGELRPVISVYNDILALYMYTLSNRINCYRDFVMVNYCYVLTFNIFF